MSKEHLSSVDDISASEESLIVVEVLLLGFGAQLKVLLLNWGEIGFEKFVVNLKAAFGDNFEERLSVIVDLLEVLVAEEVDGIVGEALGGDESVERRVRALSVHLVNANYVAVLYAFYHYFYVISTPDFQNQISCISKLMESPCTFKSLGLCKELLHACERLNYLEPTPIQAQTLPFALQGRDIIALAQTGSGKTLAFAVPVVQFLLQQPKPYTALILSPTRQLCIQISEHFQALGAGLGLKTSVLVGGVDTHLQVKSLNIKPHVVIGTPGKILFHLQNTKSFDYQAIKFLVFDQADKLLSMDFQKEINKLLQALPRNRKTYLFSATMTNKVQKLERASLSDPVRIQTDKKFELVAGLSQFYCFIPANSKQLYLYQLLKDTQGSYTIIFTATCMGAIKICLMLRKLGYRTSTINGKITQAKRINALNKFKAKEDKVLVATDVASRGLDIPAVDLVINYDIPLNPKDYIHRVGRTARAGRCGRAITLVSQYDVQEFMRIQELTGKKMQQYKTRQQEVMSRLLQVQSAMRAANQDLAVRIEKKSQMRQSREGKKRRAGKKIEKKKELFEI